MGPEAEPRQYLEYCRVLLEHSRALAAAVTAEDWEQAGACVARRGEVMARVDQLGLVPARLPGDVQAQARALLAEAVRLDQAAVAALQGALEGVNSAIGELYQVRDVLRSYLGALRPAPAAPRFLDDRK